MTSNIQLDITDLFSKEFIEEILINSTNKLNRNAYQRIRQMFRNQHERNPVPFPRAWRARSRRIGEAPSLPPNPAAPRTKLVGFSEEHPFCSGFSGEDAVSRNGWLLEWNTAWSDF